MFPIDVLFEVSRWISHPKDVIAFGNVSRTTLLLVLKKMRLFKCMNELRTLFRNTPRGFIHKRYVMWWHEFNPYQLLTGDTRGWAREISQMNKNHILSYVTDLHLKLTQSRYIFWSPFKYSPKAIRRRHVYYQWQRVCNDVRLFRMHSYTFQC